jgi:hypothetical protein
MQYEELAPISREEAREALGRDDDTYALCQSLIRVALHEEDWRWSVDQIQPFLMDPNPQVRGVAVSCIGYVARIHRSSDLSGLLPKLHALLADMNVASKVRETLQDIRQFTRGAA